MASIINATTSSGVAVSGDTSGVLQLATNGGTTAVTIDTSQNVGIGTTSPSAFGAGYTSLCVNGSTAPIIDLFVSGTRQASFNGTSSYAQVGTVANVPFLLSTNGTERMRLLTTGNILCLSGGSTTATGTGISFPATQSASSDANTLDDYEEGTWTPTATSSGGSITSYTTSGVYTKVGRQVTVQGIFTINTAGTASGYVTLSGFPFANTNSGSSQGVCRENNSGLIVFAVITNSSSSGYILGSNAAAITWTNGYNYYFNITYQTST